MKKLFTIVVLCTSISIQAQTTFWTENFGNGCNRGQFASAYIGTNGTWAVTNTGANEASHNEWYISGTAAGTSVGACNSNCLLAGTNNQTLHIGNPPVFLPAFGLNIGPDTGSTYLTGSLCGFGVCSITNIRAESPVIDCSSQSSINISFLYYEGGEGALDDATLMYSANGGVSWSQIDAIAKTTGACSSMIGGTWTAFSASLPATANFNSLVKIGFNWTNNGSVGTDPSFAVDDVVLSVSGGGPTITTDAMSPSFPYCAGDSMIVPYTITGTFIVGNVFTAQLSDGSGSFALPTNIGTLASTTAGSISYVIPAGTATGTGYLVRVVSSNPIVTGSSSTAQTINALPIATASHTGSYCAGATIQLNSSGGISYSWSAPGYSNGTQNPTIINSIAGVVVVYTVTVTNADGCSSTATTTVSVVDCSGIEDQELAEVNVYPNPTSDFFTISINENMIGESQVTVLNMVGSVVYTMSPNQSKTMISSESLGLRAGIYLIKVKYKEQNKVVRLIVR